MRRFASVSALPLVFPLHAHNRIVRVFTFSNLAFAMRVSRKYCSWLPACGTGKRKEVPGDLVHG